MDLAVRAVMEYADFHVYHLDHSWQLSPLCLPVLQQYSLFDTFWAYKNMKRYFSIYSQYFIGVLFGLGLIVSGMSNPKKILGFLDLAGNWDPSLIFVMGGAVLVGLAGFYLASKKTEAFFGGALQIPTRRDISKPLVIGSLIFGAGWGIAGFCPGPAIVAAGAGQIKALIFILAMLGGMFISKKFFSAQK